MKEDQTNITIHQSCSDFRDPQWVLGFDPGAPGVRLFDTAEDVEQHLRSDTYPRRNQTSSEMLCGAVIFDTEPWSQQAPVAPVAVCTWDHWGIPGEIPGES
jgi:hypothetical protein